MNRCAPFLVSLALAAVLPAQAASDGQYVHRNFPQNALRGKIAFGTPPSIQLNGNATTLATGARIHGVNNLLVLTGQLIGSQADVDYTTDLEGRVFEVWILSPSEAANKPWPTTPAEAAAWHFDAFAQTWKKP